MSTKNILIVDDSSMFRTVIHNELKEDNFNIFEAESAASAKKILHGESEHKIDLVILDLVMPDQDGFSLYSETRTLLEDKTPPVIFMTSNDTPENRQRGIALGALDFLGKSFVKGELLHLVKNALYPDTFFQNKRALYVDDSPVARNVGKLFLSYLNMDFKCVESAKDAIELLNKEKFDIILTDHVMPEMSGLELCTHIRKNMGIRDVPIILVSADQNREVILNFFQSGANDYLAKPFF
jgi:CheY-like chemotaxis protein